jgi:hypothetical protein
LRSAQEMNAYREVLVRFKVLAAVRIQITVVLHRIVW